MFSYQSRFYSFEGNGFSADIHIFTVNAAPVFVVCEYDVLFCPVKH